MSTDIVLINPPFENISKGFSCVKHIVNASPSLGLLHIAAMLRQAGYGVAIIESDAQRLTPEQVAKKALSMRPKYIGITLFTVGVDNARIIAKAIKKNASIPVIVGGPHISSMGKETLERFSEFDVGVLHEGEFAVTQILDAYEGKITFDAIGGILFRRNGTLVQTPPSTQKIDLDALPLPAWDLLPDFPRAYPLAIFGYPKGPVATFSASRGCPFKCAFCDTSTFGSKIRYYSPQKVFEIMRFLQEKYGIKHLQFVDDLFVANKKRITELCDLIIQNNFKMTWSCTARVDTVKPEILAKMKQAGCWEISYGLESGSNRMLEIMKKSVTVEQAEQAVHWTHEAGIRCKGLFMLGYPGEDEESIAQTKAYVQRLPMTLMNMTKFTPYPGTPIYIELFGTTIRKEDWDKMNGMNFIYKPENIAVEKLDGEYKAILTDFYMRPHIKKLYVKLALQNPNHLWRLLKTGICTLKQKLIATLPYRR
jgi:radical SAM superfamily enzyme YgiQ (UPF0313 family)